MYQCCFILSYYPFQISGTEFVTNIDIRKEAHEDACDTLGIFIRVDGFYY